MDQRECMKNFKLTIEYDGTNFNGWQIQAAGRTVQGEIERALSKMTRRHVRVIGSGRTDAGVHALGQIAAFRCETRLSAAVFFSGLNSLLPDDIIIRECEQAPDDFHPRYDATAKTYHYNILNRPLPAAIGRAYCWHIRKPLDIAAMKAAIRNVIGTHDFKAFENTGSPRSHTVRTIHDADIITGPSDDLVTLRVTANGFLRYMVRNIVATIVDAGLSKLSPHDVAAILAKKDRRLASATAPPHGLFLHRVYYEAKPPGATSNSLTMHYTNTNL